MKEWAKIVSINIKRLKTEKGWSQDYLAEKAECSKSVVRDLEAGNGSASLDMLTKIASALDVRVADLLKDNPNEPKIKPFAETLPVDRLMILLNKKFSSIPKDIYDLAENFGPGHEVWDQVRVTFEDAVKELEEKNAKAKA